MSEQRRVITIIGLGPGDFSLLTIEAIECLSAADRIYVRTAQHPTVPQICAKYPHLEIRSFDDLYRSASTFEDVYGRIVSELVTLAHDVNVIYAVPGSPSIDETTVQILRSLGSVSGVNVRVIQGVSYVEPALAAVREYGASWLTLLDAVEIDLLTSANALGEIPGAASRAPIRVPNPTAPVLISQLYSSQIANSTKLWLSRYWPDEHEVCIVRAAGTPDEAVLKLPLFEIDRQDLDHLCTLFVPPVLPHDDLRTFSGLLSVTQTLRAPGGCPWDREQSHDSLKQHLTEESYEVIDALDRHDPERLSEELGDLLFQITIHSQIAAEHGEFEIEDVIEGITTKLIRRHPHVFGDLHLPNSAAVLERWETFKQAENPGRESVLDTIPEPMPALPYSFAVQKRAASQGFDWPDIRSLLMKVDEELRELREELDSPYPGQVMEELGDLLFVLVSVGRYTRIDPEEALRFANRKFVRRFRHVELESRKRNKRMVDLSPSELDVLWCEAKSQTSSG